MESIIVIHRRLPPPSIHHYRLRGLYHFPFATAARSICSATLDTTPGFRGYVCMPWCRFAPVCARAARGLKKKILRRGILYSYCYYFFSLFSFTGGGSSLGFSIIIQPTPAKTVATVPHRNPMYLHTVSYICSS